MECEIQLVLTLVCILFSTEINSELLVPSADNIALFKPIRLSPTGSTCGVELRDTLCTNRMLNASTCTDSNSFTCDQSCPYGNVLESLDRLDQIRLEYMNPCQVFTDYKNVLTVNESTRNKFAYYFESSEKGLCDTVIKWRPFSLEASYSKPVLSFYNSRSYGSRITGSGFTFSAFFKQQINNNGTLLHMFQDENTILQLVIHSTQKRAYVQYLCDFDSISYCSFDLELANLSEGASNFITLRIYQNRLQFFINEPFELNTSTSTPSIDLRTDLGTFIVNNSRDINFFIGNSMNGYQRYLGWIQNARLFLVALVDIEISELYGKIGPKSIKIQAECRCSIEYSKNENQFSTMCIDTKTNDEISRVNVNAHSVNYVNDDDFKTSWISCSLSPANSIILEIDLENGVYLIERVEVFFASLPPTSLSIEKFYNNRWSLLQYFSNDCTGLTNCVKIPTDSQQDLDMFTVVWATDYQSDLALYSNETLVNNIRAVKIRLIMSGYDPSTRNDIRKLYYEITEIRVKGRCDCNGYSNVCDMTKTPFKCECERTSFTSGSICNECLPLYNDRMYTTRYFNSSAICHPCQCNNRSDLCVYDQENMSGKCLNCKFNSDGAQCEKCAQDHYYDNQTGVCNPCQCSLNGVDRVNNTICDQNTGMCFCKPNVIGKACDQCQIGFYSTHNDLLDCVQCKCRSNSTLTVNETDSFSCDPQTGSCNCKTEFVTGRECDSCAESTYDLDSGCDKLCNCDPIGSFSAACDVTTGQCSCKSRVTGLRCDTCEPFYFNLTQQGCVNKCDCDSIGALNDGDDKCDPKTGECACRPGYMGQRCDKCTSGYWRNDTECIKCSCNLNGVQDMNNICDQASGKCICNNFTEGFACDTCRPGFWGLTNTSSNCSSCDCDPIGTSLATYNSEKNYYVCDKQTSQCTCNPNRIGTRCESCAAGFFLLNLNGIDCLECNCDPIGSVPGSICNSLTGECTCKIANGIGGTRCDQCLSGYYNFSRTTGSCSTCDCNQAGSLDQDCDQYSGQCNCKELTTGIKCSLCVEESSNLDTRNPYGCSKSPSKQSPPTFNKTMSGDLIEINWTPPDYPNGLILFYLLYKNDTLIANTTDLSYLDRDVLPFVVYAYKIQSHNSAGSVTSRPSYVSISVPTSPCCIFTFSVFNVHSTYAQVVWNPPERLNGLSLVYFIDVFIANQTSPLNQSSKVVPHSSLTMNPSDLFVEQIISLEPYTSYNLQMRACNQDLKNSSLFYCLNGTPVDTKSPETGLVQFFTSQDRPEYQPSPMMLSLSSTSIAVGVSRPLKPNGIIILYEIWIKANNTIYSNSASSKKLACAIEDMFDPISTPSSFSDLKNCTITGLTSNTDYLISATSSTIIGRSVPSKDLVVTTLESRPKCSPRVLTAKSFTPYSISLVWEPAFNATEFDLFWRDCVGGVINNFTVYGYSDEEWKMLNTGLDSSYNITKLTPLTEYSFKIELCNGVGCKSTEPINVTTIDPPPNNWAQKDFQYEFLNSSYVKFDWSRYVPFNLTKTTRQSLLASSYLDITYKLERAEISFAFPPTPLESGIRFHGMNYFGFSAAKYFPSGYPYFGVKFSYKQNRRNGTSQQRIAPLYFASSSFSSQTEYTFVGVSDRYASFISNTQSSQSGSCTGDLSLTFVTDTEWRLLKAIRQQNVLFIRNGNGTRETELKDCTSNFISDVEKVYLGGTPKAYRDTDSESDENQFLNDNANFRGCLKNVSTIIELDDVNGQDLNSKIVDFDFDEDAQVSPGEPMYTNTIHGCPVEGSLETGLASQSIMYFLGFGYVSIDIRQSMAIEYQTDQYLDIDLDLRTQYSQGLLYFNYDTENDQFVLIRLSGTDQLEVNFKCRLRLEDPNNAVFTRLLDLDFNKTFTLPNLSSGYWTNLNARFNFINQTFSLSINKTENSIVNLISQEYLPVGDSIVQTIAKYNIKFTYYLNMQFYMGGFDDTLIEGILETLADVTWTPSQTIQYFQPLFNLLDSWKHTDLLSYSGCIRDIKINGFNVNLENRETTIEYKHVRFDGCPTASSSCAHKPSRIDVVYEGELSTAHDASFQPFTEYFYRVVTFNRQGYSYSPWFLIRTPSTTPDEQVDVSLLAATPINGYQILLGNLSSYCRYCESSNRQSPFTGIIVKFVVHAAYFDQDMNEFISLKNFSFFCQTTCSVETLNSNQTNTLDNLLKSDSIQSDQVYLDTKPLSNYSLSVSICTECANDACCVKSDSIVVTSLGEVPDGIEAPILLNRSSNSLIIGWQVPEYPSGVITGYILRMDEKIIYFGLGKLYTVNDLSPLDNRSFSIEACNNIGCGRSRLVYFQTTEMPPKSVSQPTVLNVTSTLILIKWNKPTNDQLINGILLSYVLYVESDTKTLITEIQSCLQDCSTNYKVIDNLIPGSEYRIVISACTNGGCTNSSVLRVTTLESLPLVDDLRVYVLNKTSTSLTIAWTQPKYPNGLAKKYLVFMNDKKIFEDLGNNLTVSSLDASTFYNFYVIFCNQISCSEPSRVFSLRTDDEKPHGILSLEANATGPNQVQLKWWLNDTSSPGFLMYSVYFTGPFVFNMTAKNATLNLLNTTISNTRYGVLSHILPFSEYIVQVIGSNSKGFLTSNCVAVQTWKTAPGMALPPKSVLTTPFSICLEWNEPLLLNSDDDLLFYQIDYRVKYLWNSSGYIESPSYQDEVYQVLKEPSSSRSFTLTELRPYTAYSFKLAVSNSFGETTSSWSEDIITNESTPSNQSQPVVLAYGSSYVLLEWKAPNISNGLIINYNLLVFKQEQEELVFKANISLKNTDLKNSMQLNITDGIDPFCFYVIRIESCNSAGCCVSALENRSSSYVQTMPSIPEDFGELNIESENHFSVDIKWNAPAKPNGIIISYLLERHDYSSSLRLFNDPASFVSNTSVRTNESGLSISKQYRFDPTKRRFLDYNDLTSCGIYSYRIKAFNQIGFVESLWKNVTVKASRPVIVSSPVVILLDSNSARFEWIRPLTHCEIAQYTLEFDSVPDAMRRSAPHFFTVYVNMTANFSESVVVRNFIAYTVYRYKLRACVLDYAANSENLCAESLIREFRTPGKAPEGIRTPVVRIVSPLALSIEWTEPIFSNGINLNYQLLRENEQSNKPEAVYIGPSLYFLDLNVDTLCYYRYRLICTNEFGSSIGEWSTSITLKQIQNKSDSSHFAIQPSHYNSTTIKLDMFFNLDVTCGPTVAILKWTPYRFDQIINFISSSYQYLTKNNIDKNYQLKNNAISRFRMTLRVNSSYEIQLSDKIFEYEQLKPCYQIERLYPFRAYSFSLRIDCQMKIEGQVENFVLHSETSTCTTLSTSAVFLPETFKFNQVPHDSLMIEYNLPDSLNQYYQNFRITVNQTKEFNGDSVLIYDNSLHNASSGSFPLARLDSNNIYVFIVTACSLSNKPVELTILDLFIMNNCIYSEPSYYSITTQPPSGLTDLTFVPLNSTAIKVLMDVPKLPNDYRLFYLIFRRETCQYYDQDESESAVNNDGTISCKRKSGDELGYVIGNGNKCCGQYPFFDSSNSSQSCCYARLYNKKYPLSFEYEPSVQESQIVLGSRECVSRSTSSVKCLPFKIISNQSSSLSFVDLDLTPDRSYDYKYCVSNSFATSCNENAKTIRTEPSLPTGFDFFAYDVLCGDSVQLEWSPPSITNGDILYFKVYRDKKEIHRSLNISLIDRGLKPFEFYMYELEACNKAGCVLNKRRILASTRQKAPELFALINITYSHSDITLTWRMPVRPNGVIEAFVLEIRELNLELPITIDFQTNSTSLNISSNDLDSLEKVYTFSAEAIYQVKTSVLNNFTVTITDLKAYTLYGLRVSVCNQGGCLSASSNSIDLLSRMNGNYIEVQTRQFKPVNFKTPIAYILNDRSVQLVWQDPEELNGELIGVKIFRNQMNLVNISSQSLVDLYKFGFYSFNDSNLQPDNFYAYKIEIQNEYFSVTSETLTVQTPPKSFSLNCSVEQSLPDVAAVNESFSILNLFDGIMSIRFQVFSSTQVRISYDELKWRSLIQCISRMSTTSLKDMPVFSIKILVQNNLNGGLQSLDFSYPNKAGSSENNQYMFDITGLLPFSNYTFRLSLASMFPSARQFTTQPVYLRTLPEPPCCLFRPPRVLRHELNRSIVVKWTVSDLQINGNLAVFTVNRFKLKGHGCAPFDFDQINTLNISDYLLDQKTIQIDSSEFRYDQTSRQYFYIDSGSSLGANFSFYTYKIVLHNQIGSIESGYSRPVFGWQFNPPTAPRDLRVLDAHSTGFLLQLKPPLYFNGLLAYYKIYINAFPINSGLKTISTVLMIEAEKKCQNESNSYSSEEQKIQINGLSSFQSYQISAVAFNQIGIMSTESEKIMAMTLESSPENLKPLVCHSFKCNNNQVCISFKFQDAEIMNGKFKSMSIYLVRGNSSDQHLKLYSGPSREFVYENVEPFTNYSFVYDACTYGGCTKYISGQVVQTVETNPEGLCVPEVVKTPRNSSFDCFRISWKWPSRPNGRILYFEINRRAVRFADISSSEKADSMMIQRVMANDTMGAIDDCELKYNFFYSYNVVVYNRAGKSASKMTDFFLTKRVLPTFMSFSIILNQLNASSIQLTWSGQLPLNESPPSKYRVYRDSILIHTLLKSSTQTKLDDCLYDNYEFIPNKRYTYEIEICNEAGCSPKKYSSMILTHNQRPIHVNSPKLSWLNGTSGMVIVQQDDVVVKSYEYQQIVEYRVYLNESLAIVDSSNRLVIKNMSPFTYYCIRLEACTYKNALDTGCLKSKDQTCFLTNQTSPCCLISPRFFDIPRNEFHLDVNITWQPPKHLNGVLKLIELKRDGHRVFSSTQFATSFMDKNLSYGKNYSYEFIYWNIAGHVSSIKYHATLENVPCKMPEPKCGSRRLNELELHWYDPLFSNGNITTYSIKYRSVSASDKHWQVVSLNRNAIKHSIESYSYRLSSLKMFEVYEFSVSACNKIGCVWSSIVNNKNCSSVNGMPIGLSKPNLNEIRSNSELLGVLVSWNGPMNVKQVPVVRYILTRITIHSSISFNADYEIMNPKSMNSSQGGVYKELYSGMNTTFFDHLAKASCEYDYLVEVVNLFGSRITPISRIKLSESAPKYLSQVGTISSIGSQSVTLNMMPPLELNGRLLNISIVLKSSEPSQTRLIYQYDCDKPALTGRQLINMLKNVSIDDLEIEYLYEIKSQFCNRAGCVLSSNSLIFKTYGTDRILDFELSYLGSCKFGLRWSFKFVNHNKTIRFKLKHKSDFGEIVVLDGLSNNYNYQNAAPSTRYTFELVAICENQILDTRTVSFQTRPPESNALRHSLITTAKSDLGMVRLSWKDLIILNEEIQNYELMLNGECSYKGIEPFFDYRTVYQSECYHDRYYPLSAVLKIQTENTLYSTPPIDIYVNCTNISFLRQVYLEHLQPYFYTVVSVVVILFCLIALMTTILIIKKKRREEKWNAKSFRLKTILDHSLSDSSLTEITGKDGLSSERKQENLDREINNEISYNEFRHRILREPFNWDFNISQRFKAVDTTLRDFESQVAQFQRFKEKHHLDQVTYM